MSTYFGNVFTAVTAPLRVSATNSAYSSPFSASKGSISAEKFSEPDKSVFSFEELRTADRCIRFGYDARRFVIVRWSLFWATAAHITTLSDSFQIRTERYHQENVNYTIICGCRNVCNGKFLHTFNPGKLLLAIAAWRSQQWDEISRIFCLHDENGLPFGYSHKCRFEGFCGVKGHGRLKSKRANLDRKRCQSGRRLCHVGLHGSAGPCLVNGDNVPVLGENRQLVGCTPPISAAPAPQCPLLSLLPVLPLPIFLLHPVRPLLSLPQLPTYRRLLQTKPREEAGLLSRMRTSWRRGRGWTIILTITAAWQEAIVKKQSVKRALQKLGCGISLPVGSASVP